MKIKVWPRILLFLAIIIVFLGSSGCNNDAAEIRSTVQYFYEQGAAGHYVEERFHSFVTEYYTGTFSRHGFLVYLLSKDAKEVEITVEDMYIEGDSAALIYTLHFIDWEHSDGVEWTSTYITTMLMEDGVWKMAYTYG